MGTRYTYTSTYGFPVYAVWKCEKCGEINFSMGVYQYIGMASTGSWSSKKQEKTRQSAMDESLEMGPEFAYKIMTDFNHNAGAVRFCLLLEDTHCTKCSKKPIWDKAPKSLAFPYMLISFAVFSVLIVLCAITSPITWCIFIVAVLVNVVSTLLENKYSDMILKLPKEYTPIIGTSDVEFINYAKKLGWRVPRLDEIIERMENQSANFVLSVDGNLLTNSEPKSPEVKFCRKCGNPIQSGNKFCYKCGEEVIYLNNK